jgi:hypothetical protein
MLSSHKASQALRAHHSSSSSSSSHLRCLPRLPHHLGGSSSVSRRQHSQQQQQQQQLQQQTRFIACAAAAGATPDPYRVLGVEPDADTNTVNRAYTQKKYNARGNDALTAQIEAAHSSIMMSALSRRLAGKGVAKGIAYADNEPLFPWRPKRWDATPKVGVACWMRHACRVAVQRVGAAACAGGRQCAGPGLVACSRTAARMHACALSLTRGPALAPRRGTHSPPLPWHQPHHHPICVLCMHHHQVMVIVGVLQLAMTAYGFQAPNMSKVVGSE